MSLGSGAVTVKGDIQCRLRKQIKEGYEKFIAGLKKKKKNGSVKFEPFERV